MNRDTFIKRYTIINQLIKQNGYESYLEIGVRNPSDHFDKIKARHKIGVDSVPRRNDIVKCTSDEYFGSLSPEAKFDLVFIDGLHHYEQVLRDIENSLKHLSEEGVIVCHDMLPESEEQQIVPQRVESWTGDCWKAWAWLRMTRADLEMCVINTDHGVGIITRGEQNLFEEKLEMQRMNYQFFTSNRNELMNVMEFD